MKIRIEVTDLIRDSEGGWSANCSWINRHEVEVSDDASDLTVVRAIKKAANLQGMRRDEWSGDEWCFRDGTVGAVAYVVDD